MIYVSFPLPLPAARTSPSPPQPPVPWGSWGIPAKHLDWEGLEQGWGGGFLLCSALPIPTPPCPPILSSSPPLETEELLFSIIYNLRLGPPVLSSPLT